MLKKYIQFFSLALSLILLTGFFCCCKENSRECTNGVCKIKNECSGKNEVSAQENSTESDESGEEDFLVESISEDEILDK